MSWRHRSSVSIALLIAAGLQVGLLGQGRPIPERIEAGETASMSFVPSGKAPTVVQLVKEADLIVRATVGNPSSAYLSEDQFKIYTDYPLLNPVVLFGELPALPSKPGEIVRPFAVTLRGGTITFNGKTFKNDYTPMPPLKAGSEGLFLLQKVGDRYHLIGDHLGAFGIADGRVVPLGKRTFAEEYQNANISSVVEEMLGHIRER